MILGLCCVGRTFFCDTLFVGIFVLYLIKVAVMEARVSAKCIFFFGKDCKLKGCKSKSINYFNVFFLINRFATKHFTKWNKQIMLTFVVLCCFINVFPSFIHKTNRWIISIRKKNGFNNIFFACFEYANTRFLHNCIYLLHDDLLVRFQGRYYQVCYHCFIIEFLQIWYFSYLIIKYLKASSKRHRILILIYLINICH